MEEAMFSSSRIRGRMAVELYFGLTTLKVAAKAIPSISNGVDRTEANGTIRTRVDGADPIIEATMGGGIRGIPLTGAGVVMGTAIVEMTRTAIGDITTNGGGGIQQVHRGPSKSAKQRPPNEFSVTVIETSHSAM
ncbi:MAG: hypothetical protein ABI972_16810 [Acidobacteriota bacterium]